ncbi:MAG: glycosyltransferase family 2 protein [Alphaproteobacteria bacterium]|nr:glycosyltransferase family 2 protein [Alphaproteobacteria bacterium]
MSPIVSVVTPSRNALAWLPAAIASIGDDPRVEILVVDDGSTDGTAAWLAETAARDPRLRILQGPGTGPSRARNLAITAARGTYCAFLDADDTWAPGKLDRQLALHAAHPEIGFSFTDYRHVTVEGEDRGPCFDFWPRFHARHGHRSEAFVLDRPLAALFAENVVGCSTVMARTDLLRAAGGFCADMPSSEDWDLWLGLSIRAPVGVVPGIQADYLMHRPGNLSGKMDQRILSMAVIASRYRKAAMGQERSARRIFMARYATARAEAATATGHRLRAVMLHLAAMLRAPSRRTIYDFAGALLRAA